MIDMENIFQNLKLPEMPSEEEIIRGAIERFQVVQHTQLDFLPEQVLKLMPDTILVDIPDAVTEAILQESINIQAFNHFATELDDILKWEPMFIKLASRSPKDVEPTPITCSGKTAIHWMSCSMRCFDDLCDQYRVPSYNPKMALRKVLYNIRSEYRVFIKDNELQGIAVYDERGDAFIENGVVTEGRVARYWQSNIKDFMPVDNYVFDLALTAPDDNFVVIEFNPYGLSDPLGFKHYANINRIALWND